ncbi:homocysteine-induced endoplasmic reticulum protein [Anaeramoeba flamelloides]|uniref:Homocysteine-induced endoplasmic reticulum protein n=1 Tax=Anaeramoeba flamelloides TaxID=1746091 RepID=A0ABQ8YRB7_9EUKA|nr:homocysteine-induced endoplasmic reticulum protein [Anaeramoeba flamelloides]
MIKIRIKNNKRASENFILQISSESKVLDLKQKLFEKYPDSPLTENQQIIYAGRLLKNEENLIECLSINKFLSEDTDYQQQLENKNKIIFSSKPHPDYNKKTESPNKKKNVKEKEKIQFENNEIKITKEEEEEEEKEEEEVITVHLVISNQNQQNNQDRNGNQQPINPVNRERNRLPNDIVAEERRTLSQDMLYLLRLILINLFFLQTKRLYYYSFSILIYGYFLIRSNRIYDMFPFLRTLRTRRARERLERAQRAQEEEERRRERERERERERQRKREREQERKNQNNEKEREKEKEKEKEEDINLDERIMKLKRKILEKDNQLENLEKGKHSNMDPEVIIEEETEKNKKETIQNQDLNNSESENDNGSDRIDPNGDYDDDENYQIQSAGIREIIMTFFISIWPSYEVIPFSQRRRVRITRENDN